MHTGTLIAPSAIVQESAGDADDSGTSEAAGSFDRMALEDFNALSEFDESAQWADYSPAYAVGLATYEACVRHGGQVTEQDLRDKWEELRGFSHLDWEHVQEVVARSWAALAGLERAGVEVALSDGPGNADGLELADAAPAGDIPVQDHSGQA